MGDKTPLPKLVTLIYPVRDDKILLLQRKKWPFVGFWVAPGGKVEPGESPRHCAQRELHEETGLTCESTELRAIVTETSHREDWQWLIFVYRTLDPRGDLALEEPEGKLCWFEMNEIDALQIPSADRHFMRQVLGGDAGVSEYRFDYDDQLNVTELACPA